MTQLDDISKVLKDNKDPRKVDDLRRVWPELYNAVIGALIPVNQAPVIDPPKNNIYVPSSQELLLQPLEMEGNVSFFANHNDSSTAGRKMAITLESADKPMDQWFLAMRFRYVDWQIQSNGWYKPVNFPNMNINERVKHKDYLKNRRIKVTNPANGKSIIVRPGDVGPGVPKRIVDISETAIKALGAKTDDKVIASWVDPNSKLGPV